MESSDAPTPLGAFRSALAAPPQGGFRPAVVAGGVVVILVIAVVALVAFGGVGRPPGDPTLPFATAGTLPPEPEAVGEVESSGGPHAPGGVVSVPAGDGSDGPGGVVVHVAGAVVRPGVYELLPGARVHDAIAAAGGVLDAADEGRLNLAEPIPDGSRVVVAERGQPVVAGEPSGDAPTVQPPDSLPSGPGGIVGAESGSGPGPISINNASHEQLQQLPGIGPATATAIVEHRQANGPFASVEALLDVRGIGPAKLTALADLVVP